MERRREVSPALVYPFMRSVMEAPFPAPGRTVTVKSFLPGTGNEVTLKPKEEMLIGSSLLPNCSFLKTRSDSQLKAISVNNSGSSFISEGFTLGQLTISSIVTTVYNTSINKVRAHVIKTIAKSLLSPVSAVGLKEEFTQVLSLTIHPQLQLKLTTTNRPTKFVIMTGLCIEQVSM